MTTCTYNYVTVHIVCGVTVEAETQKQGTECGMELQRSKVKDPHVNGQVSSVSQKWLHVNTVQLGLDID